jgi:uncharacterized membrane protein required for colicin V production
MSTVIDLIIVGLILGLTYVLTSEGLWGAVLMFFNVIFAGLIAFNFYEPLANLIDSTKINWGFSDTLCMLGLFSVSLLLLRMATETLGPAMVRFPLPIYHIGRLVFGLGGALVTMAIVILAFEAAPVHKKVFYTIGYDSKPPFKLGLDHQWLGFFQHTTGAIFARYGSGEFDPFGEYGRSRTGERFQVRVFDPRAKWLIEHQESRPYGDESILGGEAGSEAAAGQGAPSSGGPPSGGPPGGPPAGKKGRGGPGGAAGPPI